MWFAVTPCDSPEKDCWFIERIQEWIGERKGYSFNHYFRVEIDSIEWREEDILSWDISNKNCWEWDDVSDSLRYPSSHGVTANHISHDYHLLNKFQRRSHYHMFNSIFLYSSLETLDSKQDLVPSPVQAVPGPDVWSSCGPHGIPQHGDCDRRDTPCGWTITCGRLCTVHPPLWRSIQVIGDPTYAQATIAPGIISPTTKS